MCDDGAFDPHAIEVSFTGMSYTTCLPRVVGADGTLTVGTVVPGGPVGAAKGVAWTSGGARGASATALVEAGTQEAHAVGGSSATGASTGSLVTVSTGSPTSGAPAATSSPAGAGASLSAGATVGIVCGVVSAVCAVAGLGFKVFVWRHKRKKENRAPSFEAHR